MSFIKINKAEWADLMLKLVKWACVCMWCVALKDKDTTLSPQGRKVKRSRSKSPFRSFRWKKSGGTSGAKTSAASDDEDNLAAARGELLFLHFNLL